MRTQTRPIPLAGLEPAYLGPKPSVYAFPPQGLERGVLNTPLIFVVTFFSSVTKGKTRRNYYIDHFYIYRVRTMIVRPDSVRTERIELYPPGPKPGMRPLHHALIFLLP